MSRRKRSWSADQRAAISARMKAYHAKRRRSPKDVLREQSLTQKVAKDLPWRLTILVNNPNNGSIEMVTVLAERDVDLLPSILDHMYGGNLIHEYRLEKL
jgi:hypothetical protein